MHRYVIQIQRKGLAIDQTHFAKLRAQFRESHCVQLPQLLDPSLLDFLGRRLENSQGQTRVHPGIGEEYICNDLPALGLLQFAANLLKFRTAIEEITGCKPLCWFGGRIYRMIAGAGHYDNWHSDVAESKTVGMSLNLSPSPFRGGLFLLRECGSGRVFARIANTGLGDALLFRTSHHLEHRISDLEGDQPKTAFAGWFRSAPPERRPDLALEPRKTGTCSN